MSSRYVARTIQINSSTKKVIPEKLLSFFSSLLWKLQPVELVKFLFVLCFSFKQSEKKNEQTKKNNKLEFHHNHLLRTRYQFVFTYNMEKRREEWNNHRVSKYSKLLQSVKNGRKTEISIDRSNNDRKDDFIVPKKKKKKIK